MTPDRWDRIGKLFNKAMASPSQAREGIVRESGEPSDIQNNVISLLAHSADVEFLEPPALFLDGAVIGNRYRIIRLLGRGGMGVVYLAEDQRLRRKVALKALPPHLYRDEHMRARLEKEALAAAALQHPAIATIYEFAEFDGQLVIVTEYLEGETLRQALAGGPIPLAQALDIAVEVACGLEAAHSRGIVHRDLKPENVIRMVNGHVKILDFGLARYDAGVLDTQAGQSTQSSILAGTPRYMAPEQLRWQPATVRTDQFAFGVLVFELVHDRHPFGDGSTEAIVEGIATKEPRDPSWDKMPDALWNVIERCLRKSPADRFATTTDLVSALEEVVAAHRPRRLAPAPLPPSPPAPQPPQAIEASASARRDNDDELRRDKPLAADALWWWRFHQLTAALVYWAMVWPAWHVREWVGTPGGAIAFFATLASVIVSGNMRMHLSFTARALPGELKSLRAQVRPWIRLGDYGFTAAMVIIGAVIAGDHNGWGALFLSMGLGNVIVFLFVEPPTERAAFPDEY